MTGVSATPTKRLLRLYRAEREALTTMCDHIVATQSEADRSIRWLHGSGSEPNLKQAARRLHRLARSVARAEELLGVAQGIRGYIDHELNETTERKP